MSGFTADRVATLPLQSDHAPALIRWVCTNNPFYVVSAGLFLVGLWISFGAQTRDVDTYALMSGLIGYTLLLAVTACLLVRFARVWDDVRTVLLLVVLMFLATSVTFDEVLVFNWQRGFACYLGGLLFAITVSEGLLHGIRLVLPMRFRLPYYCILSLFFLYPLALRPLVSQPPGEELMWGLFAFSSVAGLVFLTLIPAIRQGANDLQNNGSPWPWPLYPWVLFGLLGLAVPARAILLCLSMHILGGSERDSIIFGPYFLVPFGLAIAILLLEVGLVSYRPVLWGALGMPLVLVALAVLDHRPDPVYQGFLRTFSTRLGSDPLTLTLLVSAGFYAYAALRRVPWATEALTASFLVLADIGPTTFETGHFGPLQPLPILAAGALQLGLGLARRDAWRCLMGAAGLVAVGALGLPDEVGGYSLVGLRGPIAYHLGILAALSIGTLCDDPIGRVLRIVGAVGILFACLVVMSGLVPLPINLPPGMPELYSIVLATLLAGYGLLLGHRISLGCAGLVLVSWLLAVGSHGYASLRQVIAGLDFLALSLGVFGVAILVSLGKSGVLARWIPLAKDRGENTGN